MQCRATFDSSKIPIVEFTVKHNQDSDYKGVPFENDEKVCIGASR
jgi:hypothetical protein